MKTRERRRSTRLHRQFTAHIRCRAAIRADGESENLSQGGAFIRTDEWELFKARDEITITFLLPSEFTGQDKAIGLQGDAVVTRVDPERHGVGVEFVRSFRQFEQASVSSVNEKPGTDTVAYYVATFGGVLQSDFVARYPHGFLVESPRRVFDRDVILQLDTQQASERELLARDDKSREDLFAGKVFELKKKTLTADVDKITVGRAPTNDLVLQNKLVSRQHAYFAPQASGQGYLLVDTKSTNGTFVNTRRLKPNEPCQLAAGDEILFGHEVRVLYFPSHAFAKFLHRLAASQLS